MLPDTTRLPVPFLPSKVPLLSDGRPAASYSPRTWAVFFSKEGIASTFTSLDYCEIT